MKRIHYGKELRVDGVTVYYMNRVVGKKCLEIRLAVRPTDFEQGRGFVAYKLRAARTALLNMALREVIKLNREGNPKMLKPHILLDTIKTEFGIKNDAELCKALNVAPPQISKVRNGKMGCNDMLTLRLHEAFNVPVSRIRALSATAEAANG